MNLEMWKFKEVLLDIGAVVVVVVVVDVAAADGDGEGDVIDSRKSIEEMSQYLTLDSVVETQMPFMSWRGKKISGLKLWQPAAQIFNIFVKCREMKPKN